MGINGKRPLIDPQGTEYLIMPFGLTNAPAVLQSLINDILCDMINQFVFVYLDDILILSRSLPEHVQHVRFMLQRLLENQLFIRAEKLVFHQESMSFLGFVISTKGLEMDPSKLFAVVGMAYHSVLERLTKIPGFL